MTPCKRSALSNLCLFTIFKYKAKCALSARANNLPPKHRFPLMPFSNLTIGASQINKLYAPTGEMLMYTKYYANLWAKESRQQPIVGK